MRKTSLFLFLLGAALLAACSAAAGATESTSTTGLTEDYANALSIQGQLALGTTQLEDTESAVSEAQAADLLPLWQALQALSASDTTAQAEIDGLVRQIEGVMTPDQLEAIAGMALTTDSMNELTQSGELNLGGFGRRAGGAGAAAEGSGLPAPPDGFAGGPGGGAGAGRGGGFGGELPGGVPGEPLSEDAIATRQAQFASGDAESRALIGMVVRLLETKTGQEPALAGIPEAVLAAVADATGLEPGDIQAQMGDGATLEQIVTESGADPDAVRTAIITALEALPTAANLDAAAVADRWLSSPGE